MYLVGPRRNSQMDHRPLCNSSIVNLKKNLFLKTPYDHLRRPVFSLLILSLKCNSREVYTSLVTPRGELSVSHDTSPQVTNGYIICPIKSPIQQFASSSLKEIRSDFHHWPSHLIKL